MKAEKSIGLHAVVTVRGDAFKSPLLVPIRPIQYVFLHAAAYTVRPVGTSYQFVFSNKTSLSGTLIQRDVTLQECPLSCSHKSTT